MNHKKIEGEDPFTGNEKENLILNNLKVRENLPAVKRDRVLLSQLDVTGLSSFDKVSSEYQNHKTVEGPDSFTGKEKQNLGLSNMMIRGN